MHKTWREWQGLLSLQCICVKPNNVVYFLHSAKSKEQAHIDRTEIANASAIIDALLKKNDYDKNERPNAGGKQSRDVAHNGNNNDNENSSYKIHTWSLCIL